MLSIWPTVKCVYVKHKSVTYKPWLQTHLHPMCLHHCEVEMLSVFLNSWPWYQSPKRFDCSADSVWYWYSRCGWFLSYQRDAPPPASLSVPQYYYLLKTLLITAFKSKVSPCHRISSCIRYLLTGTMKWITVWFEEQPLLYYCTNCCSVQLCFVFLFCFYWGSPESRKAAKSTTVDVSLPIVCFALQTFKKKGKGLGCFHQHNVSTTVHTI